MDAIKHRQKAERVERSLAKLQSGDYELRIEAAMLAATHWLNGSLHKLGANGVDSDVLHTYMLTINEFRRLSAANAALLQAVARIEDLRPLHVRGDLPDGPAVADEACELLAEVREIAVRLGC